MTPEPSERRGGGAPARGARSDARGPRARAAKPAPDSGRPRRVSPWPPLESRWWIAALLALHAALALWGAARNSVTFDENFHLPSGVVIVTRGDFRVSEVNPPLVKSMCALAALAAGARPPADDAVTIGDQALVGESFMRVNADRYHRVFFAARAVVTLISVVLGFLIWRVSRSLYGPRGALLSTAVYALLPESLAHAGLVTMDVATGLGFLASLVLFWKFATRGRLRDWWWLALAVCLTFLTRFTATLLFPTFILLAMLGAAFGWIRKPGRVALGIALLVPAIVLAIDAAYLGQISFAPIIESPYGSNLLLRLQAQLPNLWIPLPDSYLAGLDHQLFENQTQGIPTFLMGRIHPESVWYYYPLAILFKWPLAFLALVLGGAFLRRRGGHPERFRHEVALIVPALLFLASVMFFGQLNFGVRYLFPMIPLLCVWIGGWWLTGAEGGRPLRSRIALGLAALLVIETAGCAPWFLTFFNWPSGGPGGGERLVNDSNVDWGQGLIDLRDQMKKRGIQRIHLAYHGTTDPSVYGIDYVPFLGGTPGPESDWLAVSSFYRVGQSQRMMTQHGRTGFVQIDVGSMWNATPVARPARCMTLYRIR